jgi:hypothetical protein
VLLVHVLSTTFCAAAAGYLVVFDVEFVVIRQFFARDNSSKRKYDDVLLTEYINDLRVAVWLRKKYEMQITNGWFNVLMRNAYITRVINESRRCSAHCGIDDQIIINFEHVAADSLAVVVALTFISKR